MSSKIREDGYYNVKLNNNWVVAEWVTNQDIDSYWSCWLIEGIAPPKDSWGFTDEDFEIINETKINNEK